MDEQYTYQVRLLQRKYLLMRGLEIMLLALGISMLTGSASYAVGWGVPVSLTISLLAFSVVMALRVIHLNLHKLNTDPIVHYLNHQYPELEDSTDLLLRSSSSLTLLQQLQQAKVRERFKGVYPHVQFPNRIKTSSIVFVLACTGAITLTSLSQKTRVIIPADVASGKQDHPENVKLPANIKQLQLHISAPAYTGIEPRATNDPQLTVAEGSTVRWNITFTNPLHSAHLVLSNGDSIPLTQQGSQYQVTRVISKPDFYQITWREASGETRSSDYYKIEMIRDRSPEVSIKNLSQFTEVSYENTRQVSVTASIKDDYRISDAYIIATVSKGSGESVKFREEKLLLTAPKLFDQQQTDATRTIDLVNLGLEPGDELYFYAEAWDNKTPSPNRSRTETYFIAIKDTASQTLSVEGGLGVDLMPEYFRSQRQIIIDSEKLLRERKSITKQEFNARSNELGYDQKVLRLKYGEFLGEEFESGINIENHTVEADDHDHNHAEHDVVKRFGHLHDTENEHNHVEEKRPQPHAHTHQHDTRPEQKANPLEEFVHSHDDAETATFFIESIRTKLKAALTVMWDAELHLRLYDPEKSLPYQYKALKLLKEISNDSRIYVHKTGFDPPPLKEDKRLSGDLDEIKSTTAQATHRRSPAMPGARKALVLLESKVVSNSLTFNASEKQVLATAGSELAALALEQPAQFLQALSLIKSINEDEIKPENRRNAILQIRKALYRALPPQVLQPTRHAYSLHPLEEAFIQNMKAFR